MKKGLALLLLVLLVSCDGFGLPAPGPSVAYDFAPEQQVFTFADTIRATFVNRSDQTAYLFRQGCLYEGVQRQVNADWREVTLPIGCIPTFQHPTPIEPGGTFYTHLPPWLLEPDDVNPGTYRLDLKVGLTTDKDDAETVVSTPFDAVRSE